MMGAPRRPRNARLKGGRYTGRIAFPLAFCGQNDIFSGSSHYSKINGKESGGLNASLEAFLGCADSTTEELGRFR
jgi:hypothetical protein